MRSEPADDVLARQRTSSICRLIDEVGHDALVAELVAAGGSAPAWSEDESICTFCQRLLSDPQNVSLLAARGLR